ncbi:alkylphosphonate utilization protein [Halodesulfovibrio sp.]|jgi:protein PhnA|uniref:alkylphosphonate utilization protein n=1 Tax=Halodesulfovibrio sp. TaxID=1912772 RepID=UPI0025D84E4B|nr:alkylphosphonate utilization protein [Halodesulfovibrio sp.]MCT4535866.1 alkylphosphonate utilization protein [Halodesulfovibrio sp.]MCT4626498.1 alkylphosphonate utilization protein [Halodesulfovibrio sp.]
MDTKDSNGNVLNDGDNVQVTKDLKVKGASMTLKRGTTIKKIRLTSNPEHVECRVGKGQIVLKTCFLKKV